MSSSATAVVEPLPRAYRTALAVTVLLGGSVLLLALAPSLAVWLLAAGWVGLLLLGVFLLRESFVSLVGPVLLFDMVRTARRLRVSLLRALYVTVLLVVLFAVYLSWFGRDFGSGLESILEVQLLSPNELARFAASVFETFLIAQYAILMFFTPFLCGGAIAEEREKGTLTFLLTTHLTTRQIIVGKLFARVSHLLFLLLAGIPVLALLQLLGGVDPVLLVIGFGHTLLTTISMAALSLLFSVYSRSAQQGVFLALVGVAGWQLVFGSIHWLFMLSFHADSPGNRLLWQLLASLLTNGITTGVCLGEAFRGLRNPVFFPTPIQRESPEMDSAATPPEPARPLHDHPPIGDGSALVWKERYVGTHRRSWGRNPDIWDWLFSDGLALFLAIMAPFFLIYGVAEEENRRSVTDILTPLFICSAVVYSAYLASRSIGRERDQRTLESLLTADLTNEEILKAKWLGIVLRWNGSGWVFAVVLVAFALFGAIPILGVPLVLASSVLLVVFAVNLGLYCSLVNRTSYRATVITMGILLGVTLGHWLLYPIGIVLLQALGRPDLVVSLRDFHTYALTPPRTLAALATLGGSWENSWPAREAAGPLYMALAGLLLYAVAASVLWLRLRVRFGPITGRMG